MRLEEIEGRAVHENGDMRVDRRPETKPSWEYQALVLMDPDDDPEWVPVSVEEAAGWPVEGWQSVEEWKGPNES